MANINTLQKKRTFSPETIEKIRESNKKRYADPEFKKQFSDRLKEVYKDRVSPLKGRKGHTKGKHNITPEYREKLSIAGKNRFSKMENRIKQSEALKGKNLGFHHTEETKQILKEKNLEYRNKHNIKGLAFIGKNEKALLDYLELCFGEEIIRQYRVKRYSIDGYIPKYNLCIEIDETEHLWKKEKDKIREDYIKKTLNCNFLRIQLYG